MEKEKNQIAADVHLGFVRSLFFDSDLLLLGAFTQGVVGGLVYWKTQAPVYIFLTLLMVSASIFRYLAVRRIEPLLISNAEQAKEEERHYTIWGAIHAGAFGLFSFYCLYVVPDFFAEIAAISISLASVLTIACRNFGSPRMVIILTAIALGPVALGLMMKGDFYNIVLGVFIVPVIFAVDKMARFVRGILFTAISEEQRARKLAQRFDRALNTMSHGLIMLDSDGRVAVANSQATQLLQMRSPDAMLGRTLKSILLRVAAAGLLDLEEYRQVARKLGRALREGHGQKVPVELKDGRHFEMSAREGRFELGVITFEEITERVEAERRIRSMARFDQLTALPNRAYFQELVAEKLADGDPSRSCGLVIIDLDDFKSVNDKLGHPVGDGLIYEVGQRISLVRDDAVVCRFGGDEFMVFYDRVADEQMFAGMVEGLFASFSSVAMVAGNTFQIRASAGAVMVRASEFQIDETIVKADLALHVAKRTGKNRWQLFEDAIDEEFRTRHKITEELRAAIESRSLNLVYQPIVALNSMRIASCEALCRWNHPELGVIAPSVFIPLAEESGFISDISSFVLETACRDCATWPTRLCVSVNLSAMDFSNGDLVKKIRRALKTSGLEAHRLEIEVTETALLEDKLTTVAIIKELRNLGVRVALDDFGTGYSALSYLHELPLDKIKIDRSFLLDVPRDTRSLELLVGITKLCQSLGVEVTVEGVETFDQLSALVATAKPDLLQGFLFGSALTANGITTFSKNDLSFGQERAPRSRGAVS